MTTPTIGIAVKWILDNRTPYVFKDYTEEQIAREVIWSIKHNTFVYSLDEKGEIDGIGTGQIQPEPKTFYARNVIVKSTKALKNLFRWVELNYPEFKFTSHKRNGKERLPMNTVKIIQRLK